MYAQDAALYFGLIYCASLSARGRHWRLYPHCRAGGRAGGREAARPVRGGREAGPRATSKVIVEDYSRWCTCKVLSLVAKSAQRLLLFSALSKVIQINTLEIIKSDFVLSNSNNSKKFSIGRAFDQYLRGKKEIKLIINQKELFFRGD